MMMMIKIIITDNKNDYVLDMLDLLCDSKYR